MNIKRRAILVVIATTSVAVFGLRVSTAQQPAPAGSPSRTPLDIARLIAGRYPTAATMNYIPAVTWVHTLRLAADLGDQTLRGKVLQEVDPWLTGASPLFGERVSLTAAAGTIVFDELARAGGMEAARPLAAAGFAEVAREKAPGVPQAATGWTDDMFMAPVVLTRRGAEGRASAGRLLLHYASTLQRNDGLFNHAPESPVAWGRGNGFAALGLAEYLSSAPEQDASRAAVLEVYRRHMAAMRAHQDADGLWRQVVDVPASYLELSVSAMTVSAMARGIRAGWLDASYRAIVERAWRAVLTRVNDDGTVVGVCTSTGAGPTLEYYLTRQAISGADDRGAAFVLGAALDMIDLAR